jgi:hypothetical protein
MENVGIHILHPLEIYYGHWYILWAFGNFEIILYILPRFGKLCQDKFGNPEQKPY